MKPAYANGFDPVAAPEHSATRVASALMSAGARYGILLTSDKKGAPGRRWVTRDDLAKALLDLKARMRADGAKSPRVIFYMMGHGLGDRVGRQLIMLPGNLIPLDSSQSFVFKLQKRGIWYLDVVSSLVNFRTDPRMSYMDDVFPSRLMPNPFDWKDLAEAQRYNQELEARQRAAAASPGFKDLTNPPVPFVTLFDNCYGGIVEDLVNENTLGGLLGRLGSSIIDAQLKQLEDDGLVLYAAKPGVQATDYPDPDQPYDSLFPERSPKVGLLAARLLLALRTRQTGSPLTLAQFAARMGEPLPKARPDGAENPPQPYSISPTNADVARTELVPPDPARRGQLDRRFGTGTTVETCCR